MHRHVPGPSREGGGGARTAFRGGLVKGEHDKREELFIDESWSILWDQIVSGGAWRCQVEINAFLCEEVCICCAFARCLKWQERSGCKRPNVKARR